MQKKPSSVKKIQGTLKISREKSELTYDPLTSIPAPAFKLSDEGLKYFERFCEILISNKTLTIADVPVISRAARWFEIYTEADINVRLHGASQVTSTGYTQKSGYFTVMADADDRVTKIEALYGMNLTARTKINIPKPDKGNNPIDDIINGL